MLEYCRGAKEEGEALSNTMMKKLSGRQYFDNFYYKTKYYLPDRCFIIILPETAPLATDKAFQSTAVPSIATSAVQYAYRYTYKVFCRTVIYKSNRNYDDWPVFLIFANLLSHRLGPNPLT